MNFTVARRLRQVEQHSHFSKGDSKVFNVGYFSNYFLVKLLFFYNLLLVCLVLFLL